MGCVSDVPAMIDEESRQAVRPAGKFRIYLGSAAGVGKTCAMLDEGCAGTTAVPTWSSGSSRPTGGPTPPS